MCWILVVGYMPNAIRWAANVRSWPTPAIRIEKRRQSGPAHKAAIGFMASDIEARSLLGVGTKI
jgi:hypothetical protein